MIIIQQSLKSNSTICNFNLIIINIITEFFLCDFVINNNSKGNFNFQDKDYPIFSHYDINITIIWHAGFSIDF